MMRRISTFAFVLSVSLLVYAVPSYANFFKDGKLSVTTSLRTLYDSNVLRYSSNDRDRYLNSTESHITPVESLDDVRFDLKLSANYVYQFKPRLNTSFQLTVDFAKYVVNPINDINWASAIFRHDITREWSLWMNHFYMPSYYLRDFNDSHTRQRLNCDYSMTRSAGRVHYRYSREWEFIGKSEFSRYSYNPYFTEYDGDYVNGGFEVVYRINNWRISGSYALASYDNSGFSSNQTFIGLEDLNEDSESGMGHYQQDEYSASVWYTFRYLARRSQIRFALSVNHRFYSADRSPELDPIHHGRRDLVVNPDASFHYNITPKLTGVLGVAYTDRESKGSNPIVARVKTYNRYECWFEMSYALR